MQKIFKRISSFLLAIVMCLGITAVVNTAVAEYTVADAATDYYASITASKGTQLLGQLHDLITSTHKTYTSYTDCKTPETVMKTDPGTANNTVRDFYTQENISSKWDGNSAGSWNREHVWCQSLSNGLWGESGGGSDMHHIRPSEVRLNGTRGNHTFGEANGGTPAYYKDSQGKDKYVGGHVSGDTFEPLDKVKGDVARIVMYVYTHYNSYNNSIFGGFAKTNGSGKGTFGTLNYTKIMTPGKESDAIALLLKWNKEDPVNEIETTRNEAAYVLQGNRNPFIDHPEYADAIWGNGEVTPGPGGSTTVEPTSITLNPSSLNLLVGASQTISVSVVPTNASKTVTWSTSNSSVATVSGGTVTAKKAGTATITATSTENSKISATCTITVTEPPVQLKSLTMHPEEYELNVGKGVRLFVTGEPAGADTSVNWSSSAPSVATVDNSGNVAAIAEGTATITATSKGNSSITATCKITVTKADGGGTPAVEVESIKISPSSLTLTEGGNAKLNPTVKPSSAKSEIEWSSSDTGIAQVGQDGTVIAISAGTATITASSKTNPEIKAEVKVTVEEKVVEELPDEALLAAFHSAVASITPDGSLSSRLAAINSAIKAYKDLTDAEIAVATEDIQALQAAIEKYNEDIASYNDFAKDTDNSALSGFLR